MIKNRKRHEYDDYFYGLVLAKSKALVRFVNEHTAGSDYARKQILLAKYELSKLHPVLRGFFIRALHTPNSFKLSENTYLTSSRDIGVMWEIEDHKSPYGSLQYKIQDKKIMMEYGRFSLTSEPQDVMIYKSVFKALKVKKQNADAIDFNIQKRQQIAEYMKNYGNEYP